MGVRISRRTWKRQLALKKGVQKPQPWHTKAFYVLVLLCCLFGGLSTLGSVELGVVMEDVLDELTWFYLEMVGG